MCHGLVLPSTYKYFAKEILFFFIKKLFFKKKEVHLQKEVEWKTSILIGNHYLI